MEISSFFDEIDHNLMLKAVSHVIEEKRVKLYIERWLEMPIKQRDVKTMERHASRRSNKSRPLKNRIVQDCNIFNSTQMTRIWQIFAD